MRRWALILVSVSALAAEAGRLNIGETMPAVAGETLSGQKLELPAADTGRTRVLVFSFAKAASADSKQWNERFDKDLGPAGPIARYRLIFLESVPRLFRGMAVSGIRSGLPHAVSDKTLLVYKDEDAWKTRLAVSNDKHSYVVVLGPDGRVRWLSTGAFNQTGYAELQKALGR